MCLTLNIAMYRGFVFCPFFIITLFLHFIFLKRKYKRIYIRYINILVVRLHKKGGLKGQVHLD